MEKFKCEYCQKEYEKQNALNSHKIRCKLNPNMTLAITQLENGN